MTQFAQQVTFLYAADLDATCAFYAQTLGLPLVLDQGACRIYRVSGDAFVGICRRVAPAEIAPQSVILTLVTHDVDGWARRLTDMGVVLEKPPQLNANYNIYHFFVRDPAGYRVEIQRFLDPAWPEAASDSAPG